MAATVAEYMTADPVNIDPQSNLYEAMELMRRYDFRQLPVTAGTELLGILTDRDIRLYMTKAMAAGVATTADANMLERVSVEDAMTRSPLTVAPGTELQEAVELLLEEKVGALPVVAAPGSTKLVGILSYTDMLNRLVELLAAGE